MPLLQVIGGGDTAQLILGTMYAKGDDAGKVEALYKLSAGNSDAQFNLGVRYLYGRGIEKDNEEAFRRFKLSAEGGHVLAQDATSTCYWYGVGVKKDVLEAFYWAGRCAGKKNLKRLSEKVLPESQELSRQLAKLNRKIATQEGKVSVQQKQLDAYTEEANTLKNRIQRAKEDEAVPEVISEVIPEDAPVVPEVSASKRRRVVSGGGSDAQ